MHVPKQTFFRLGEHLITALASIAASYFVFVATSQQTDANLVDTCYNRIQDLEQRQFEQTVTITKLKIELAKKYEPDQSIKQYLDALPFPAWIKRVEKGADGLPKFVNSYINGEYAARFGISKARYLNRTDFDVWSDQDVAQSFYENDMHVLKFLDSRCKTEFYPRDAQQPVTAKNPMVQGYVCKFPATVNGELSIAGMSLERSDIKP